MSAIAAGLLFASPAAAQRTGPEPQCQAEKFEGQETFNCRAEDGPFAKGLNFETNNDIGLVVNLEDDLSIVPEAGFAGLTAKHTGDAGYILINGANASVSTKNATGIAIDTEVADADLSIGSVVTSGDQATGISAKSDTGYLYVRAGSVATSGNNSIGIDTYTKAGFSGVYAGQVATTGDYSHGIRSKSEDGHLFVFADSVQTSGRQSNGIDVTTKKGFTYLSAGTVETTGEGSIGVKIESQAPVYDFGPGTAPRSVDAVFGTIKVSGDGSIGLHSVTGEFDNYGGITTYGQALLEVGTLDISGNGSLGAWIHSGGGAHLKVENLLVNGDGATALNIMSYGSDGGRFGASLALKNGDIRGLGTGGLWVNGGTGQATALVEKLRIEDGMGLSVGGENVYVVAGQISGNIYSPAINASSSNDALVNARTINNTAGSGIFAFADGGKVDIEAGSVTGYQGIEARAGTDVNIHVGSVTSFGERDGHGIRALPKYHGLKIRAGSVATSGTYSNGIVGVSRYGSYSDIGVGSVTTTGDDSSGILAIGEDAGVKIAAESVSATGKESHGIEARTRYVQVFLGWDGTDRTVPFNGDINIDAGTVDVTGEGAYGIIAKGMDDTIVDAGSVRARDGNAIDIDTIKDATLDVRARAESTEATAVNIKALNATVNIAEDALVKGGTNGIVIDTVERCLERASKNGMPNPCSGPGDLIGDSNPFPGDDGPGDGPGPGPVALEAKSPGIVTIDNAGTISGASDGYALWVKNGTVTVNNSGVIDGVVKLADGNDTITNSGTMVLTASNDFGAGFDRLINSGTIKLGTAGQALNVTLQNLEQLDNSNLIDLRNGRAGDKLVMEGNYVGSGNAKLGLDISFGANKSDSFIVNGAATGQTQIVLASVTPEGSRLTGDTPIELVKVGAGSSANAFVLDPQSQEIGFVRYSMNYDASALRYVLDGTVGSAAYRLLNIGRGADNAWQRSTDALSDRFASTRDLGLSEASTKPSGVWGYLYGGDADRGGNHEMNDGTSVKLDYHQKMTGGQLGYEFAGLSLGESGTTTVGVTAGFQNSELTPNDLDEKIKYSSINAGVYANLTADIMFANAIVKYDRHSVKASSSALDYQDSFDASSIGAKLEAGLHLGGRFFVEPVAGLTWLRTSVDDMEALGQTIEFETASGLFGNAGVRGGTTLSLGGGSLLALSAGAEAIHAFDRSERLTLHSDDAEETIGGKTANTYYRGTLGMSYRTKNGMEFFLRGHGDFGNDHEGVGGSAGFRIKL